MATTGERIRDARKAHGMTQKDLADKVGVKFSAIHKYENGLIVNLKRDTISALAKALEVSPAWLMCIDDEAEEALRKAAKEKVNSDRFFEKSLNEQDFLLSVSEDEMQLLRCYRRASLDDRALVELALRKYRENPEQSGRSAG